MRKTALLIIFVLALGSYAFAESKLRIGFVNIQKVANESEPGARARNELEGIIKERQSQIDKMQDEMERLQKELDQQSAALSEDALKKREDEIQTLERDLQRLISDSNTEIQRMTREKQMAIQKELKVIIDAFGAEDKFSLILPSEILLYGDDSLDITDKVIKKYNESKKDSK